MEQSIGVFGEDALLWLCLLTQSPQRPQPNVVHQQANYLLEELRISREAQALPVKSVEDGMFAIAALFDEVCMSFPDLRPLWSQNLIQATRFNTNNAGVELFERLQAVRQGPPSVLATYAVVLGLGFKGCYGLPGADPYVLYQLRLDLSMQLGVNPDRDWSGGVLNPTRDYEVENLERFKPPWHKTVWFGRALAGLWLLSIVSALLVVFL